MPDTFYLVVATDGAQGAASGALLHALAPFDGGLWAAVLLTAAAVGAAMWAFGEVPARGRGSGVRRASRKLNYVSVIMCYCNFADLEVGEGFRLGMEAVFQGSAFGAERPCRSRAGAVVRFGYGFFCMVLLAMYTANLARAFVFPSCVFQFGVLWLARNHVPLFCASFRFVLFVPTAHPQAANMVVGNLHTGPAPGAPPSRSTSEQSVAEVCV